MMEGSRTQQKSVSCSRAFHFLLTYLTNHPFSFSLYLSFHSLSLSHTHTHTLTHTHTHTHTLTHTQMDYCIPPIKCHLIGKHNQWRVPVCLTLRCINKKIKALFRCVCVCVCVCVAVYWSAVTTVRKVSTENAGVQEYRSELIE